jgi:hypothetical protein
MEDTMDNRFTELEAELLITYEALHDLREKLTRFHNPPFTTKEIATIYRISKVVSGIRVLAGELVEACPCIELAEPGRTPKPFEKLSIRARRVVITLGIKSPEDLAKVPKTDIAYLRNCGAGTRKELIEFLKSHNLTPIWA